MNSLGCLKTIVGSFSDHWRPIEKLTVSECATKYRIVSSQWSRRSGPWKNARTPFGVGMMDAFSSPSVRRIVVMASAQTCKSESSLNDLLWAIKCRPGPAIWVCSNRATELMRFKERLKALSSSTPSIQEARNPGDRWDQTSIRFRWRDMVLWLASSKSVSDLGMVPCMYAWGDEVDKWDRWTGEESSPLWLMRQRLSTFDDVSKEVLTSTPTTEDGPIAKAYNESHALEWEAPCPRCGWYQALVWDRVKWRLSPDEKVVESSWYECANPGCSAKWSDEERWMASSRGIWRQRDEAPAPDKTEDPLTAEHIGFHVSRLMTLTHKLSRLVKEFLDAKDFPERLMSFRNNVLALPITQTVGEIIPSYVIGRYTDNYKLGQIPEGVWALTAGVDVHDDHLRYAIWGWGLLGSGWLISYGMVANRAKKLNWPELAQLVERQRQTMDGRKLFPLMQAVDTGWRTDECYDYVRQNLGLRHATKGASPGSLLSWRPVDDAKNCLTLNHVNDSYYKGVILGRLSLAPGDPGVLRFPRDPMDDFWPEFTSEKRDLVIDKKSGRESFQWVKKPGRANHYLDCSKLAFWAADSVGLWQLTRPLTITEPPPEAGRESRRSVDYDPDDNDWIGPRPGRWV